MVISPRGVAPAALHAALARHPLLLTVHHVAFDGASRGVLLGELGVLCGAPSGTTDVASLPPLALQYVDFALWQRGDALAPHLASQRAYWRSALREGDLAPLELPLDFPRPAVQTFAGDAVPARVAAEAVAGLEALGRSAGGCTLFQLVLSVWAVLLCRHAGQEEVVVGSPYHGRDAAGTEALIGYFVNVLALRVEAPRGGTVSSLAACARDAASGGMRHALLPFQAIVHELLPRRAHDASRNAVFQSCLLYTSPSPRDKRQSRMPSSA